MKSVMVTYPESVLHAALQGAASQCEKERVIASVFLEQQIRLLADDIFGRLVYCNLSTDSKIEFLKIEGLSSPNNFHAFRHIDILDFWLTIAQDTKFFTELAEVMRVVKDVKAQELFLSRASKRQQYWL